MLGVIIIGNFLKKLYGVWLTNVNYIILTAINIVLVCLTKKLNSDYFIWSIYSILFLTYLIDIKNSYKFLIVWVIFLCLFLIFYKYNLFVINSINFYQVYDVKDNYFLLSKGLDKYYLRVGEIKLAVGEYVKIVGEFKKLNGYANFWEFDFGSYLNDKNVIYEIMNYTIEKYSFHNLRYYFFNNNQGTELMNLFFYQQRTNDPIYKNLVELGLSFMLNLSGFYLYGIALIFNKVIFRKCKKLQNYKIIFTFLLLIYCYLLRWPSILLKFIIFSFINWFAKIRGITLKRTIKNSLVWSIMLIWDPLYVYNIGFIYSSVVIVFLKKFQNRRMFSNIVLNFINLNLVFIPIQMYLDYKVFWISEIQQMFLLPNISICYFLSFFGFLQFLDPIFTFFYSTLNETVAFLKTNNVITHCGHFSVFLIFAYYLCLFVFVKSELARRITKNLIKVTLLLIIFFMIQWNQFKLNYSSVDMLNVGNGNSFVLIHRGEAFLFDTGKGKGGYGKNLLKDYLNYLGVRTVNTVFISHNHEDHYNLLETIKDEYNIENIFYNYDKVQYFSYKDLKIDNFVENGNKDENDNSQISVVKIGNRKMVFTGDTTKKREYRVITEKRFIESIGNGVDLFQVGHHGSKTSSSKEFISLLKPKYCFISGENIPSRPFPNIETINTLNEVHCKTSVTYSRHSFRYEIDDNIVREIKKEL